MDAGRSDASRSTPLARFLERIRKTISHDLRTPLGTIVNYAAILEASQGADDVEVRDLGRRIRSNAMRAARMIQLLSSATGLASRPLRSASTDLLALARSIFSDAGSRTRVLLASPSRGSLADVDVEVLGFAWRAYVAMEIDTLGHAAEAAEVAILEEPESLLVELRCTTPGVATSEGPIVPLELGSYLRHTDGSGRHENALALGLAQDLILSHEGSFQLWGRPGAGSGLRLRFARAA